MRIDIQTQNFSLSRALRDHVERRASFALACCEGHIKRIVVRLSDINGPRRGVDKCCQLQVVLANLPDVVVKDIEADMYVAIDRATSRSGRTVMRKICRQQALHKQGLPSELKMQQSVTKE